MMTPTKCFKCHVSEISKILIRQLETFEEEHQWRCLNCGRIWYTYTDMTDLEEIRDMKLYVEQKCYERGDY